jgi:Na+-transporting NADH:ubiquinone oxidoreductase subunit C
VIPVRGAGLWGPIWGNVAVESDMNTVRGVTFDHAGETPGLGAEISTLPFQQQFQNKKLFDESNRFVSIKVEKTGTYTPNNHTVDAISGGTITSKALEAMIRNSIEPYQTYFSQQKSN